ncbi:MAG TPA: cytochrome c [Candidatus Sulfotelmatobacter sp.]|jgi:cytochrome c55X|nr:cytochrome c [Candidatus Sulfotelmatobacter sp.]
MMRLGGLILLCGLAASPALAGPDATRQGELEHMVRQDCGSCHGMTLKGGLGSPLLPENLAGKDDDFLAATILDGRPGTAMPPWRGMLSDQDVHWIVDYLKEGRRD